MGKMTDPPDQFDLGAGTAPGELEGLIGRHGKIVAADDLQHAASGSAGRGRAAELPIRHHRQRRGTWCGDRNRRR